MRYIKIEDLLKIRSRWGQGNELGRMVCSKRILEISSTISVGIQRCPSLGKMYILTTFVQRQQ